MMLKNKVLKNKDLRKFLRQFITGACVTSGKPHIIHAVERTYAEVKECEGCECDIDAIIEEVSFYANQELIARFEKLIDKIDSRVFGICYSHGISFDDLNKEWEDLKKEVVKKHE